MSRRRSWAFLVLLVVVLAVPSVPPAVARAPSALPPAAGPGAAPIVRHVLPNGLRLLVRPLAGSGLAAVSLLVGASSRAEEASQAGVAVFTREVMLRGTAARTGAQIALALESLGGTLRAGTTADYTQLAIVVPARRLATALDILAEIVTQPRFDPQDVEAQRRLTLARIRAAADDAATRAFDLLSTHLYPYHPYGRPLLGTPETVTALTREALVAFHRATYTGPNMVLTVAGDVEAAPVAARVRRAFAAVPADPPPAQLRLLRAVEAALAPRPSASVEVRESRGVAAGWVSVGYLGARLGHADWPALRVLAALLGTRLFAEIRDRQGLAYVVGASFASRAGPGPFLLAAGAEGANLPRVVEGLLQEVRRVQETAPPTDEVERARNRVIGALAIEREDLAGQAFALGWLELLGLGAAADARLPDLVGRVAPADIQRVARRYLTVPTTVMIVPAPRPGAAGQRTHGRPGQGRTAEFGADRPAALRPR